MLEGDSVFFAQELCYKSTLFKHCRHAYRLHQYSQKVLKHFLCSNCRHAYRPHQYSQRFWNIFFFTLTVDISISTVRKCETFSPLLNCRHMYQYSQKVWNIFSALTVDICIVMSDSSVQSKVLKYLLLYSNCRHMYRSVGFISIVRGLLKFHKNCPNLKFWYTITYSLLIHQKIFA